MNVYLRGAMMITLAVSLGSSVTVDISYSGGVQTGTFEVRGTAGDSLGSESGIWNYPDTVVIDGSVRLVVFTEELNERRAGSSGPRRHWYFMENSSGPVGFLPSQDTVWTSAQTFPSGSLSLDTIDYEPDPLFTEELSPANLTGVHAGLEVGTHDYGGLGYPTGLTLTSGHNRIVYFRTDKPGGESLYGKLMIYDTTISSPGPPYLTDGPRVELRKTVVAYTLSSSSDINSGSVVAIAPYSRVTSKRRARLIWSGRDGILLQDAGSLGKSHDLNGKRRSMPTATKSSRP